MQTIFRAASGYASPSFVAIQRYGSNAGGGREGWLIRIGDAPGSRRMLYCVSLKPGEAHGYGCITENNPVVEDDPLSMRLFSDVLRAHGYNVLKTGDGMEALVLTRQHRPDLILMDIQLPGVSGLEVVKWVKEDDDLKAIPIVAVTAAAMKDDKARILRGGCEDYLAKPVPLRRLLTVVEQFLSRFGSS